MKDKRKYSVPAAVRVLDIFEYLCNKQEATFSEIYQDTGIPKSSAYQILRTLEDRGYVRRAGDMEKFTLGLRLMELGDKTALMMDIRTEAMPTLRELNRKTNETCHLGIVDGNEGVYIGKVEGSQPIRLYTWEGKRLPLHSTSLGKVLLAWLTDEELNDKLSKLDLTQHTPKTITDPQKLIENLYLVREQGWALDDQENEIHFRCIGVPVFNKNKEVIAAISLTGLATVLDGETLSEMVRELKVAAHELSVKVGMR
jgi:DNA-binding IclR family transcriptional regulator